MDAQTLAWWNERAARHPNTPMYKPAIEGLARGELAMTPEERELMGDVHGKRVLHAQCHIGTDSLSWVLLGAEVTGVDLSAEAVMQARVLSERLGLPATFIESDITQLPEDLVGFDAVVASIGVIPWIEDLKQWWASLARTLKPGGHVVVVDLHPAAHVLEEKDGRLEHTYAWFHQEICIDEQGTYAEPDAILENTVTREYAHSFEEILGGALAAGLELEVFREYRRLVWKAYPMMTHDGIGYRLPPPWDEQVPLMFGVRFRKPA